MSRAPKLFNLHMLAPQMTSETYNSSTRHTRKEKSWPLIAAICIGAFAVAVVLLFFMGHRAVRKTDDKFVLELNKVRDDGRVLEEGSVYKKLREMSNLGSFFIVNNKSNVVIVPPADGSTPVSDVLLAIVPTVGQDGSDILGKEILSSVKDKKLGEQATKILVPGARYDLGVELDGDKVKNGKVDVEKCTFYGLGNLFLTSNLCRVNKLFDLVREKIKEVKSKDDSLMAVTVKEHNKIVVVLYEKKGSEYVIGEKDIKFKLPKENSRSKDILLLLLVRLSKEPLGSQNAGIQAQGVTNENQVTNNPPQQPVVPNQQVTPNQSVPLQAIPNQSVPLQAVPNQPQPVPQNAAPNQQPQPVPQQPQPVPQQAAPNQQQFVPNQQQFVPNHPNQQPQSVPQQAAPNQQQFVPNHPNQQPQAVPQQAAPNQQQFIPQQQQFVPNQQPQAAFNQQQFIPPQQQQPRQQQFVPNHPPQSKQQQQQHFTPQQQQTAQPNYNLNNEIMKKSNELNSLIARLQSQQANLIPAQ